MKFSVVVCDAPWSFSDKLSMSDVKRGASANYNTMALDDLKSLPVKDVADPTGCLLALWVPSSLLADGLELMNSWGFQQKQTYIWTKSKQSPFKELFHKTAQTILSEQPITKDTVKKGIAAAQEACASQLNTVLQFNMGRLFRQTHEIALIGINNNGIYKKLMNRSQRSVSFASNLKHSAKPEALQDALELMFPLNDGNKYLEMFARRQRDNWICLGNEIGIKEDIKTSLDRMIKECQ